MSPRNCDTKYNHWSCFSVISDAQNAKRRCKNTLPSKRINEYSTHREYVSTSSHDACDSLKKEVSKCDTRCDITLITKVVGSCFTKLDCVLDVSSL